MRTRLTPSPVAVVIARGDDFDVLALDSVHQSVLPIDAPGPEARQLVPQGFRLADAFVAVAHDIGDEIVDALDELTVGVTEVLLPCGGREDKPHATSCTAGSIRLRSFASPRSNSAIDRRSAAALLGFRRRYSVSFIASYSASGTMTTGSWPDRVTTTSSASSTTLSSSAARFCRSWVKFTVRMAPPQHVQKTVPHAATTDQMTRNSWFAYKIKVGRRDHHANPPATIAGDPLQLRLRRPQWSRCQTDADTQRSV